MADHAAPSNLVGYLFSRDVMSQSMRLRLAGAWEALSELTETLKLLEDYCPLLVQSFLPLGEQILDDEVDGAHVVVCHNVHRRAQLSVIDFRLSGTLAIGAFSNPSKLPRQHPFIQDLLDACLHNYGKRVVGLGNRRFKLYARIAFTNK